MPVIRLTKKNKDRAAEVLSRLERIIPNPETALIHDSPFQLLIATILSAQCTDERVNAVTPALFKAYPDANSMSAAEPDKLLSHIRSVNFCNNKAKNIRLCAQKLVSEFSAEVPQNIENLISLAGVGRKTANVVLGSGFGAQTVVVDTHVRRVCNRLKFTRSEDPVQIEQDLMRLLPEEKWTTGGHRLLLHGRHTCKARKPLCEKCVLVDLCPEHH